MAALEEFELGIDHIRNAFKRADNGFTNAYKMLETQQQKNHKLKAENAKLRELVRDMRKALFTLNVDHCQACPRDTINGPCTKYLVGGSDECSFEEDMRELGIEVDE